MCHIMSQLLEFVKSKSDSHTNSENKENSSDSNFETENAEIPRNDSCPLHKNTEDSEIKSTCAGLSSKSDVLNGVQNEETENIQSPSQNKNLENNQSEHQKNCNSSEDVRRLNNGVSKPNFSDILSTFSVEDLQSLIVKNKHGEDTLFCDTGTDVLQIEKTCTLHTVCKIKCPD